MDHLAVDIVGYAAAVVTNVSIYPQAYEVYVIVRAEQYEKLHGLSLYMYILQTSGCLLWLVYACIMSLYPIVFGSVLCLVPSTYIVYNVYVYRHTGVGAADDHEAQAIDSSEIIVASGNMYADSVSSVSASELYYSETELSPFE